MSRSGSHRIGEIEFHFQVVLPEDLHLLQRIDFTDASGEAVPKFEFISQLEGNGLRKGVVSEIISLSERLQISV